MADYGYTAAEIEELLQRPRQLGVWCHGVAGIHCLQCGRRFLGTRGTS
jgi:hypothetical protein